MLSEIASQKKTNTMFRLYVESNEQTELTRKNGDRLLDREQDDSQLRRGDVGGGGMGQKGKRTHGRGQQWGGCEEEGDVRGLNGNGKKCNKDFLKIIFWK